MIKIFLFSALLYICLAAPTPAPIVDSDEIAILSQSQPCRGRVAGTRLRHPTDDHKYLRCVGPESFWIETCPDNLFFNQELDLCDWTPISETTTVINDIVKFRPVLFRNNKTVDQVEVVARPVVEIDKSKLPVRVVSSRIRDDTDVAEVRQVPIVVESDEDQIEQPEVISPVPVQPVTTTARATIQTVRPVVVDVEEHESIIKNKISDKSIIKKPTVVDEIVVGEDQDNDIIKQTAIVTKPVSEVTIRRPSTSAVEEVDVIKPKNTITMEEVDVVKSKPANTKVEEVDVIRNRPVPGVTIQKPVTVVESIDLTPKPIKFIARQGASGVRVFGALSNAASPKAGLPFSTANVIRTDFVNHKTIEPTLVGAF